MTTGRMAIQLSLIFVANFVVADERVEMARMCSSQIQANYQKLKTWAGTVTVEDVARTGINSQGVRLFRSEADAEFMVDFASDSLYSSFRRTKNGSVTESSGETVEADDSTCTFDSIITPTHFLHSNPMAHELSRLRNKLPTFDESDALNRVVIREDSDTGRELTDGSIVFDPRKTFTIGQRPYWEILDNYAAWIDGGKPVDIEIEHVSSPVHGVRFVHRAPDGTLTQSVFDKSSGWHLVAGSTKAPDGFHMKLTVEYQLIDDIYVPLRYDRIRMNADGVLSERHLHFVTSALNQPIDDTNFSISKLVPADGTRIVDQIENQELRLRQGDLVTENEFVAAKLAEARMSSPRRQFLFWNALLVAALSCVFFVRRHRQRRVSLGSADG